MCVCVYIYKSIAAYYNVIYIVHVLNKEGVVVVVGVDAVAVERRDVRERRRAGGPLARPRAGLRPRGVRAVRRQDGAEQALAPHLSVPRGARAWRPRLRHR